MLYIGLLVPYLGLHGNADLEERPLQFSVQHVDVLLHPLKIGNMREKRKHCQRHYGPVILVWWVWFSMLGRLSLIWFGKFGLAGLVWIGRFGLVGLACFGRFG